MSRVFAITSSTDHIVINPDRKGEATFTVTNTASRSLRGQIRLRSLEEAKPEWFTISGETERDFTPGSTEQVTIRVQMPPGTKPGKHSFRIDVVSVENPDEDYSEGPVIALRMGVAAPAKPFPWWILIVVCLAIVLVSVLVYVLLPQKVEVPDVVQERLEEARKKIEAIGLSVKEISQESDEIEGKVIDQKPRKGKLKKGSIVELTVAVAAMVDVPMVTGRPFREATREIARSDLTFEKIEKEDPSALEETVVAQDPTQGRIKKGGAVKLTVSVPSAQPKKNIVLLGPQGSGKTTLASAISKVLSEIGRSTYVTYDTLAENSQKQVEFKTAKFSYRLVDLPDDVGLARFLLDENSKADAAIFVVSAVDDRSRIPEFLDLAKRKGISSLVVFISKADLVPERDRLGSNIPHSRVERFDPISNVSMTFVAQEARPRRPLRQLLEVEIRKLLTERGYDGAGTPVVFGSALGALQGDSQWKASVMELIKSIENYIEPRLQSAR